MMRGLMAAALGTNHSAAVGEDGSLFVWGSSAGGQLGTGDTASRLAPTRRRAARARAAGRGWMLPHGHGDGGR